MEDKFQYLVASKGEFMAVSFVGPLDNAAEDQLANLYGEIQNQTPRFVVLNFRDASTIERGSYRMLTIIQKLVRTDLGGEIRCCGISPLQRRELEQESVVRANEICDNVRSALDQFLQMRS